MKLITQRCIRASRLCLGLLFLSVLPAHAVEKPVGTFASAGALGNPGDPTSIYGDAQLKGVLIRAYWSTLEPTAGNFNFSSLTSQISNVQSAGLSWSLAIMGGGIGSPSWLTNPTNQGGLGAPYVTYSFRGVPGYKLPLFWNSIVQTRLEMLADALAAQYNNDASLKLVYVTQMTANGIEGHLQGVDMPTFVNAGYSDANWISASKQAAHSFADAFTNKAIAFEVHDVNGTHTVAETIINDLWNDPTLEQRVGAAMWWISGRTDYQPDLIDVLMDYPGDIYGQVIAKSYEGPWKANTAYTKGTYRMPTATPPPAANLYRYEVTTAGTSGSTQPTWPTTVGATVADGTVVWTCRSSQFLNGDFATVLDQAMALGMRYIEPWDYEFTDDANTPLTYQSGANGAWDPAFADFNDWVDEYFIAPAAPTGLTAAAGQGQIMLDWNDNGESDLAGYLVFRSTSTGGTYTEITPSLLTTSAYTDTAVVVGTTYYYKATAVDLYANESNYSTVASAAADPITLLDEGFESNFNTWTDDGTTDWDRATSQKKSGSYSAHAGSSDNDLISDNLNTAGRSSITISFWYRDDDIDDDDDVYLQLYNGSSYVSKFELNLTTEDTWTFYTVTLNNSGGDAQYFVSNFRLKFEGTSIDSGENLWIDDVTVTVQ